MARRGKRNIWMTVATAAVILIAAVINQGGLPGFQSTDSADSSGGGVALLAAAYAEQRSNVDVAVDGTVDRLLSDDRDGSRHQRFVMKLANGQTVLVAHNIDLADRVPLSEGDTLRLQGVYEWNDRGGVVHWTHHDPQGRRDGGWIEHAGKRYQ